MRAENRSKLPQRIGRFDIRRCLGKGAQGIVLLGYDKALEREVAVKLMTGAKRPTSAVVPISEGKIAGALHHPNIVSLYEYGQFAAYPYLVFEYVLGRPLDKFLQENAKLEPELVCSIFEQLLDATAYLHDKGFIHRDLKPANILVTDDGVAKITDFGVSAALDGDQAVGCTGTLRYLAPEAIEGEPPRPGLDVYALGLILVEMLTGEQVLRARDTIQYLGDQIRLASRLEQLLDGSIAFDDNGTLRELIVRSLEPDWKKRFADAGQLRDAWKHQMATMEGSQGAAAQHSTIEFLLRRIRNMDSFSAVSQHSAQLLQMVESDSQASGDRIANAVAKDITLSRQVLGTANRVSVGFAEITTVSRAVVVLGLKQLRACLLHALLEQQFESGSDELQDQLIASFHSAVLAKELAVRARHRALTETYMAAMFSDLGTTLTIHYLPEEFALIERDRVAKELGRAQAFELVLGVPSHELGVAISIEWGLPQLMLDAMHPLPAEILVEPSTSQERSVLVAQLARECTCALRDNADEAVLDNAIAVLMQRTEDLLGLDTDEIADALDEVVPLTAKYARLLSRRIEPANPIARLLREGRWKQDPSRDAV